MVRTAFGFRGGMLPSLILYARVFTAGVIPMRAGCFSFLKRRAVYRMCSSELRYGLQ